VSRGAALLLPAALLFGACQGSPVPAASAKHAGAESCEYDVTLAGLHPAWLEVEARCNGGAPHGFEPTEPFLLPHVHEARTLSNRALSAENGVFALPAGEHGICYRLDLDAIAGGERDFDVGTRIGDSILAPASSWLLRPTPARPAVPLNLRVRTPPGSRFATGLREIGPHLWEVNAHELHVATYSVFGKFELDSISIGGRRGETAELELVTLDGELDAPRPAYARFLSDAARAVAEFWRGFPVRHALVVLVPVRGRSGILFGKVLPESAPGIVILAGQHSDPSAFHRDWIVVHELFHLGFPSFQDEGKWLDEGLATYYEPLIRARAGWQTERDVWNEFVRAMPQGLPAVEQDGLEHARNFRGIYWGGAIIALLADVEVRRRSSGRRGLEDGLRALLDAGGHSSEVWPLERAIAVVDQNLDGPVLRGLADRHALRGARIALGELFTSLGVRQTAQGVTLDDRAPLAPLRRALIYGQADATL
jgi:hypothetical protein